MSDPAKRQCHAGFLQVADACNDCTEMNSHVHQYYLITEDLIKIIRKYLFYGLLPQL